MQACVGLVSFGAAQPHFDLHAGRHLLGGEVAVEVIDPGGGDVGMGGGQVVEAGQDAAPVTEGATGASSGAVVEPCLVGVTFRANPPGECVGTGCHLVGWGAVAFGVPFGGQVRCRFRQGQTFHRDRCHA